VQPCFANESLLDQLRFGQVGGHVRSCIKHAFRGGMRERSIAHCSLRGKILQRGRRHWSPQDGGRKDHIRDHAPLPVAQRTRARYHPKFGWLRSHLTVGRNSAAWNVKALGDRVMDGSTTNPSCYAPLSSGLMSEMSRSGIVVIEVQAFKQGNPLGAVRRQIGRWRSAPLLHLTRALVLTSEEGSNSSTSLRPQHP
jgi:hypothetical protein